jgi:hypothetical protein
MIDQLSDDEFDRRFKIVNDIYDYIIDIEMILSCYDWEESRKMNDNAEMLRKLIRTTLEKLVMEADTVPNEDTLIELTQQEVRRFCDD